MVGRRGKPEVKRIVDNVSRRVTFCKRRGTLLKKACELAVLCDDDISLGLVVFSSTGKLAGDYCSPNTRWSELIQRYERERESTQLQVQDRNQDDDHHQQVLAEVARLRQEIEHLEGSLRRQTGEEDLLSTGLTAAELHDLQQHVGSALGKVRQRKDELLKQQDDLLNQQLDESHRKAIFTRGAGAPPGRRDATGHGGVPGGGGGGGHGGVDVTAAVVVVAPRPRRALLRP